MKQDLISRELRCANHLSSGVCVGPQVRISMQDEFSNSKAYKKSIRKTAVRAADSGVVLVLGRERQETINSTLAWTAQ